MVPLLQAGQLNSALEVYEWLVSGRDVTEPIPADITTFNTIIKACHQVCRYALQQGGCDIAALANTACCDTFIYERPTRPGWLTGKGIRNCELGFSLRLALGHHYLHVSETLYL
jgi:hypothetical protein